MDEFNVSLLEKSLSFHGLPLQKAWEEEKGATDLKRLGLVNLDYSIYFARQRSLNFNDRAKRLRLHQFICKKANYLFDTKNLDTVSGKIYKERQLAGSYATIPPFDFFSNLTPETRSNHFYSCLQPGDTVYGTVASKTSYGLLFKILCTTGSTSRFVADLNIKAFIYTENLVNAVDKKIVTRSFQTNDYICAEVLEILPDVKKIGCGMRGIHDRPANTPQMGLIVVEDFPSFYKICLESPENLSYNSLLEDSVSFQNPSSVDNLMLDCGLDLKKNYTNMSSLKGKFPQEEYATELRHQQTSKLAVRSVAEGIEHFKNGRHTEAFQCLNRALSIDANNVEGLVARGALCANSGFFKKAVGDFEAALKLNPTHVNARKYLCETLVALGRNYEDENKIEEAKKAYLDCLKINPQHEEALSSLDYLKSKTSLKQIVPPAELEMPLNIGGISSHKDKDHDFLKKDDSGRKDKKNKKDKKKRNKKRHSSSSESSSDSSDSKSSDSSSESSSSDSSDSSDSERPKKKDRKEKSHQKSLSPLSKRMAVMSENIQSRDGAGYQYNQGYDNLPSGSGNVDDYEMKVRKFLEMPRDEDDYEEKVRKFVAEASKLQKAKQQEEKASKKKKKKDERKMKKESKKKKKKDDKKKGKNKKDKEYDNLPDKKIRDALKLLESFPDALNDLYGKSDRLDKDKDEPPAKQLKPDPDHGHSLYDKEDDFAGGKWKMMFSKDERNNEQMTKNKQPKQYAFGYDSEDDEQQQRNAQNQPSTSSSQMQPVSGYSGGAGGSGYDKMKKRHSTPPKPKEIIPPVSQVKSGPVVLDKFGNFRLAQPTDPIKPPEPSHSRRTRSRSRKKYDSSSSRSKSRSPRRRSHSGSYPRRKYSRSRSHSYGRRSGSRSRSRSYSRSRSRSRSGDRRRFSKNYRGRGGGSNYDRGTYYKPRFSNNLRGRGRGSNGNFRDSRDFRGRGRFDRTPYRPRAGSNRGNGRQFDRYDYRDRRRDTRSRSYSLERERPIRSPHEERHYGSDHERDVKKLPQSPPDLIEGRWADDKRHDRDADVGQPEDYDKILDKARKEKKEEMLERNKDMVKKSSGW